MKAYTSIADKPQRAALAADILKAIAHPLRLRLIAVLAEAPTCVGALADRLDAKQPIVSQQLRILRMQGLVDAEPKDGLVVYRLVQMELKKLLRCMNDCCATVSGPPQRERRS
jgi:ArsR family transcriptional regulator